MTSRAVRFDETAFLRALALDDTGRPKRRSVTLPGCAGGIWIGDQEAALDRFRRALPRGVEVLTFPSDSPLRFMLTTLGHLADPPQTPPLIVRGPYPPPPPPPGFRYPPGGMLWLSPLVEIEGPDDPSPTAPPAPA